MITPSSPRAVARVLPAVPSAVLPAVLLVVGALLLGACGSSGPAPASSPSSTASSTASPASSSALTLVDGWVKAVPSGMTSVFGTLTNPTDGPVTVVAVTSPAAGAVELHEVVGSGTAVTMRPKTGGFTVPARGTHVLAPGHDHLMLMDLVGPVLAGSTVTLTLVTATGASITVTALAKDFAAGNEGYAGSPSSGSGSGMGMGMGPMSSGPSA